MKFRTEINLSPSPFQIKYNDPVLLIGSCFTENIGRRLENLLFQTNINPFGVVYNPLSVKRALEIIIHEKKYEEADLNYYNDLYYSWDHHSSFSATKKKQVLEKINREINLASRFLKKAKYIFISFGTSWVYRLKESGNIVCNCHKVPAENFDRQLLTTNEIYLAFKDLIDSLILLNPQLRIIFTVSPVRHWKDGAHGNQLSKSILHLAIQEIQEKYPEKSDYFPSYEIVLDDLRDYRFFSEDLLHPNDQAIDYIWEKFSQAYFDEKTLLQISRVEELVKASMHRFTDPGSEASRKFKEKQLIKMELLKKELSFLNWNRLSEAFKS